MTSVLRPNPAAFDGHWYTPAQMAALLGVSAEYLGQNARAGRLPGEAIRWDGHRKRLYNAGPVLAYWQQRQDGRKR